MCAAEESERLILTRCHRPPGGCAGSASRPDGNRAFHETHGLTRLYVIPPIHVAAIRSDAQGSLRLPRGVRVPPAIRARAKEEARRIAIAELTKTWDQQRDTGEAV
jgi:hypothetical protein